MMIIIMTTKIKRKLRSKCCLTKCLQNVFENSARLLGLTKKLLVHSCQLVIIIWNWLLVFTWMIQVGFLLRVQRRNTGLLFLKETNSYSPLLYHFVS
ncbi:unnamed protein product [Schistosoma curassoni]|uniref:Ovule protein n=1 Tax=Schistosoma curassoni TaxID=6186 RepID=A0A183JHJ8_9TREM|nr:unnamed protein product [Schistosoma curassoni]